MLIEVEVGAKKWAVKRWEELGEEARRRVGLVVRDQRLRRGKEPERVRVWLDGRLEATGRQEGAGGRVVGYVGLKRVE